MACSLLRGAVPPGLGLGGEGLGVIDYGLGLEVEGQGGARAIWKVPVMRSCRHK